VNRYDDDEEIHTFCGFRRLAIDASPKPLPDSPRLRAQYGSATGKGTFTVAKARASPLDDVLNGIVVDAIIASFRTQGPVKVLQTPVISPFVKGVDIFRSIGYSEPLSGKLRTR
jgi:hypothetical protein